MQHSNITLGSALEEHFRKIQVGVFQTPYPYTNPIDEVCRPVHGAQHAAQSIWIAVYLAELWCKYGQQALLKMERRRQQQTSKKMRQLGYGVEEFAQAMARANSLEELCAGTQDLGLEYTLKDIFFMTLIAVLFHDSGREDDGEDYWDEESASKCREYLVDTLGIDGDIATRIGNLIRYKDMGKGKNNILLCLLHDADCLGIIRAVPRFKGRKLYFYQQVAKTNPHAMMELTNLICEIRSILAIEGDYYFRPDYSIKKQYENSPDCFSLTYRDFCAKRPIRLRLEHYFFATPVVKPSVEVATPEKDETTVYLQQMMTDGKLIARGVARPSLLPTPDNYQQESQGDTAPRTFGYIECKKNLREVGNPERSAALLGYGAPPFCCTGFLLTPSMKDIAAVSVNDFGSGHGKKREEHYSNSKESDIVQELENLRQELKLGGTVPVMYPDFKDFPLLHNELILTVRKESIKAIYYSLDRCLFTYDLLRESRGFPYHEFSPLLLAIHLRNEYREQTDIILPIYKYSAIANSLDLITVSDAEIAKCMLMVVEAHCSKKLEENKYSSIFADIEAVKATAIYGVSCNKTHAPLKLFADEGSSEALIFNRKMRELLEKFFLEAQTRCHHYILNVSLEPLRALGAEDMYMLLEIHKAKFINIDQDVIIRFLDALTSKFEVDLAGATTLPNRKIIFIANIVYKLAMKFGVQEVAAKIVASLRGCAWLDTDGRDFTKGIHGLLRTVEHSDAIRYLEFFYNSKFIDDRYFVMFFEKMAMRYLSCDSCYAEILIHDLEATSLSQDQKERFYEIVLSIILYTKNSMDVNYHDIFHLLKCYFSWGSIGNASIYNKRIVNILSDIYQKMIIGSNWRESRMFLERLSAIKQAMTSKMFMKIAHKVIFPDISLSCLPKYDSLDSIKAALTLINFCVKSRVLGHDEISDAKIAIQNFWLVVKFELTSYRLLYDRLAKFFELPATGDIIEPSSAMIGCLLDRSDSTMDKAVILLRFLNQLKIDDSRELMSTASPWSFFASSTSTKMRLSMSKVIKHIIEFIFAQSAMKTSKFIAILELILEVSIGHDSLLDNDDNEEICDLIKTEIESHIVNSDGLLNRDQIRLITMLARFSPEVSCLVNLFMHLLFNGADIEETKRLFMTIFSGTESQAILEEVGNYRKFPAILGFFSKDYRPEITNAFADSPNMMERIRRSVESESVPCRSQDITVLGLMVKRNMQAIKFLIAKYCVIANSEMRDESIKFVLFVCKRCIHELYSFMNDSKMVEADSMKLLAMKTRLSQKAMKIEALGIGLGGSFFFAPNRNKDAEEEYEGEYTPRCNK